MTDLEIATQAAKALDLLTADGKLAPLDSLLLLDFVEKIEAIANISLPSVELRRESFHSLETVAAMLVNVRDSAR